MSYQAPVLTSDRLRLREPAPADLPAFHALRSDLEMMRWLGGAPDTEEAAWHRLLRYVGHWRCFGYGFFLIEDLASGTVIGELGLAHFRRGFGADFDAVPEAGWALGTAAQGRGYGVEALQKVLAWADERFPHTVCMIDPANTPSLKLAARVGYRPFAERPYHGSPRVLLERNSSVHARPGSEPRP